MNLKQYAFVALGSVSLLLGVAGIFLPLLPATPFLLLSSLCFAKGHPRIHAWLLNHPWLGAPIRDWEKRGAIRTRVKLFATLLLAANGAYIFQAEKIPTFGKLGFTFVALSVLCFLWTRPSR